MKTTTLFAIAMAIGAGLALAQDKGKQAKGPAVPGLTLTTTAFADGSEIPSKFTMSAADGNTASNGCGQADRPTASH